MFNKRLKILFIFFLTHILFCFHGYTQEQYEFGVEKDLTVLGISATAADPNVEIKGFTVFGSTQASYSPNIPIGPGNVIVNGYLGVSSGAYFVGGSTFAAQGAYFLGVSSFSDVSKVYIGGTGAANNKALLYDGTTGSLKWGDVSSLVSGDNLGNHIATMTITANYGISASTIAVSTLTVNNAAIIAKKYTEVKTANYTLTTSDFGKTFISSSTAQITYTLPSVSSSDIGAIYTFVKVDSGSVVIDAPANFFISDSTNGGTLYNNTTQNYATVTIMLATPDKWVILGGDGVWYTN